MKSVLTLLLTSVVAFGQAFSPNDLTFSKLAAGGAPSSPGIVSWNTNSVLASALLGVPITNSGLNTLQLVLTGVGDAGQNVVIAVTNQAGTAFTKLWTNNASTWTRTECWYLINPPAGSNTVSVSIDAGTDQTGATVYCVTNAHQATPFTASVTNSSTSGTLTITIPSAVGELVVGGAATDGESSLTIAGGGTNPAGAFTMNGDTDVAAGYWTGAASVGADWTFTGGQPCSGGAASIRAP